MSDENSYRPDLPDFGAYLTWPTPGTEWLHPDDIAAAEQLIPSRRVFHRVRFDGTYYHLEYGDCSLRVRPTLWSSLPNCDLRIGYQVELLSHFGQFDAGIAFVEEIFCNRAVDGFVFRLRRGQMTLPQIFLREHFRLITLRHRLRTGYYMHLPARFVPPQDLELLNVGQLE